MATITFNGKKYDTIREAVYQAAGEMVLDQVKESLAHLQDRIDSESGLIDVTFNGDSVNVKISGFSSDLEKEIDNVFSA